MVVGDKRSQSEKQRALPLYLDFNRFVTRPSFSSSLQKTEGNVCYFCVTAQVRGSA